MELPKVKKKRSDVSKRMEANKDIDFVCIKMSWNTLCKNNYLKQLLHVGGCTIILLSITAIVEAGIVGSTDVLIETSPINPPLLNLRLFQLLLRAKLSER